MRRYAGVQGSPPDISTSQMARGKCGGQVRSQSRDPERSLVSTVTPDNGRQIAFQGPTEGR